MQCANGVPELKRGHAAREGGWWWCKQRSVTMESQNNPLLVVDLRQFSVTLRLQVLE